MSPADLAGLALLDPDQGVCPKGPACGFAAEPGWRICSAGEHVGLGLICRAISDWEIDPAARFGAEGGCLDLARLSLCRSLAGDECGSLARILAEWKIANGAQDLPHSNG